MKNIEAIEWLMYEYQQLLNADKEYRKWREQNTGVGSWQYKGKIVPKAEFNRVRLMLHKEMLKFENER